MPSPKAVAYGCDMHNDAPTALAGALHQAAIDHQFSGVIRVDEQGAPIFERAYGLADRAHDVAATVGHRFGVASVAKGFTALTIGALVDDGQLSMDTPVRSLLGDSLPLIDDSVTISHLLSHTSGIGDYIDESDGEITDFVLTVPVHLLDRTEAYVAALDGNPQVSAPGSTFAYNNAGFVVLALVAERVSGIAFSELVADRVFRPAGMMNSGYPSSNELPGDVARGYLWENGLRTNVLHLPVTGSGDGGAVTTTADLASFWLALLDHRIVTASTLASLIDPLNTVEGEGMRYGRGFWRGLTSELIILEGYDAGVSTRTWHDPATGTTASVIANTSDGAWPVLRAVDWN